MGVLMNITCGPDLTIDEVSEAASTISEAAHEDAKIYFGTVFDENAGDEMRITVIATGIDVGKNVATKNGSSKLTLFGGKSAGGAMASGGAAAEKKTVRPRGLVGLGSDDDLSIPAYLRNKRASQGQDLQAKHAPGEDDFIFDEEEFEIPSFIRRQAD